MKTLAGGDVPARFPRSVGICTVSVDRRSLTVAVLKPIPSLARQQALIFYKAEAMPRITYLPGEPFG